MSVTERSSREFDSPDLDGLLRSFFRSEMPDPWPTMKAPVEARFPTLPARPVPRRWTSIRGKLALAASISLLMAGSWLLTGGSGPDYSQPAGESPLGNPGGASSGFIKDFLNGKKLNGAPTKSSNKNADCCDCCK